MQFLRGFPSCIFIVIALVLPSCKQHKESLLTKKYLPAALKLDAKIFGDVMQAMHPAIGIYRTREYYTRLFDSVASGFNDSLTEKQFRLRMKLAACELHCGHTEVLASNGYYRETNKLKLNYSPYVFLPVDDKVFVLANLNKKQDSSMKKGYEVTKINGTRVDSILRYSRRFVSSDGFNGTAAKYYVQYGFNSYFLVLFGRPDSFYVEFKKGGTATYTTSYKAIQLKTMPPIPLERKDSLFVNYKRAGMKYKYLDPDRHALLLKIGRFSHTRATKAYRRIFRRLDRNRARDLVIDLRGNGGGSLANAYRLLSYLVDTPSTQTLRTGIRKYPYRKYTKGNFLFKLTRLAYRVVGEKKTVNDTDNFVYTIKPRKRHHFKGRVFVLTNGGSFSASCLVAAYLKQRRNTIIIGEETGGAAEGCNAGITPYYKLPNTGLKVRVPAFRVLNDVCPTVTGRGVMPDFEIKYSIDDIFKRRDLELEKVNELINKAQ